jgi:hypothetical protein
LAASRLAAVARQAVAVAETRKKKGAMAPFLISPEDSYFQVVEPGSQILALLGGLALQLYLESQVVQGIGVAQCVFVGDLSGLVEVEQRHVESQHAEFPGALHDLLDFVNLALEDQF